MYFLNAFDDFIFKNFLTHLVVSQTLGYSVVVPCVYVAFAAHHDNLRFDVLVFFVEVGQIVVAPLATLHAVCGFGIKSLLLSANVLLEEILVLYLLAGWS